MGLNHEEHEEVPETYLLFTFVFFVSFVVKKRLYD